MNQKEMKTLLSMEDNFDVAASIVGRVEAKTEIEDLTGLPVGPIDFSKRMDDYQISVEESPVIQAEKTRIGEKLMQESWQKDLLTGAGWKYLMGRFPGMAVRFARMKDRWVLGSTVSKDEIMLSEYYEIPFMPIKAFEALQDGDIKIVLNLQDGSTKDQKVECVGFGIQDEIMDIFLSDAE